jgi:hypothetical protein
VPLPLAAGAAIPFNYFLQHYQQLGLVAPGQFKIAAGQAGGDVGKAIGVGDVKEGEFRPFGNPLGE